MYIQYNLHLTNCYVLDLYMQRHIKTYYNVKENFVCEM